MKIIGALKNEDIYDIRVSHGRKWLVWDNVTKEFMVYGTKPYGKFTRIHYCGNSESDAVQSLLQEE